MPKALLHCLDRPLMIGPIGKPYASLTRRALRFARAKAHGLPAARLEPSFDVAQLIVAPERLAVDDEKG